MFCGFPRRQHFHWQAVWRSELEFRESGFPCNNTSTFYLVKHARDWHDPAHAVGRGPLRRHFPRYQLDRQSRGRSPGRTAPLYRIQRFASLVQRQGVHDALVHRHFRFGRPHNFNDPFDYRPHIWLLSWFAWSHRRGYEREAILGRWQAVQIQIGPREQSGGTGRLR